MREVKIAILKAMQDGTLKANEARAICIEAKTGLIFKTIQNPTGETKQGNHALIPVLNKANIPYIHVKRIIYAK